MTTENNAYIKRLNEMIAAEEEKINGLYTLLGKRCFEVYTDSNDAELEQLVSKVRSAKNNIDEYNRQIEKLSATVKCPNCDNAVSADAQFCSCCGFNMNATDCCKSCGAVINDGFAFCVKCGAKVAAPEAEETTEETPVAEEAPTIGYDVSTTEAPVAEEAADEAPEVSAAYCTACGAVLTEGFAFCTECGTKVAVPETEETTEETPVAKETPVIEEAAAEPAIGEATELGATPVDVAEPIAEPEANSGVDETIAVTTSRCKSCGAVLTEGFAFCTECGTKVVREEPVAAPSFCTNCGSPVAKGSAFCTNCGNRVS